MSMHPQQELAWIWMTLWNDMRVCEPHLKDAVDRTGNPWRRHYVRSFFALVEAVTHNMRELVLARNEEGKFDLSEDEFFVLKAKRVELRDNGEIKGSTRYYRTKPNILFTLKVLARYAGRELEFRDLGKQAEWKTLERIYAIRNEITHPKTVNNLVLDDEQMQDVKQAGDWFVNTVGDLLGFDVAQSSIGDH